MLQQKKTPNLSEIPPIFIDKRAKICYSTSILRVSRRVFYTLCFLPHLDIAYENHFHEVPLDCCQEITV